MSVNAFPELIDLSRKFDKRFLYLKQVKPSFSDDGIVGDPFKTEEGKLCAYLNHKIYFAFRWASADKYRPLSYRN